MGTVVYGLYCYTKATPLGQDGLGRLQELLIYMSVFATGARSCTCVQSMEHFTLNSLFNSLLAVRCYMEVNVFTGMSDKV